MNRKGFTVSSIMYPTFIIIITLVVLTLISLIQSTFSINKLVGEIKGDITDNNTMKSLKGNAEDVLKETNSVSTLYNATDGKIYTVDSSGNKTAVNLTGNENTTNWQGQFFTKADGTENMLINNGTYCAYKIGNMSGVAVYNSGTDSVSECAKKIGTDTNCSDVVTLMDNSNTVTALQNQVNDLQNQINDLKNNNTTNADFLKTHPVGTIYTSTVSTNPGNTYGGTWVAYAQGRVLVGAGSTTDSRSQVASFSGAQTGGEYNQALTVAQLPSHSLSVSTSGTISGGSCYATGTTDTAGAHSHTQSFYPSSWEAGGYGLVYGGNGFNDRAAVTGGGMSTSTNGDHTHTFHTSSCSVSGTVNASGSTSSVGSNSSFNIQNPYIVVYIWRRTN